MTKSVNNLQDNRYQINPISHKINMTIIIIKFKLIKKLLKPINPQP